MSRDRTRIHQVLVAFGAADVPRATLEAAAELAAVLDAEVRALLVEESWLERGAEHPLTAELCLTSRTIEVWNPDRLRLQLRARAEQVRRALRQLTEARGVRASFDVTRGDLATALEQAGGSGVLTAVTGRRVAYPTPERSRHGLATVLRRSRGITLVYREGSIGRLPILVYYSGTPSSRRALEVVAALRRGRRDTVRVLLPPAETETSLRLVADVERWRAETGLQVVTQQLASRRPADLLQTLLALRRSLIVLPAQSPVLRGGAIERVLEAASAVLVVRA